MVFSSPLGLGGRQLGYRRRQRRRRNKRVQPAVKANPVISNSITSVSPVVVDNVDSVLCEILSRLPVKSLTRFKCVCKSWRYLIERDQHFIDLHLTRSRARPYLFVFVPFTAKEPIYSGGFSYRHIPRKDFSLTAELFSESRSTAVAAAFHTITQLGSSSNADILGPMNGLIGFFNSELYSVRICNVSTGETTPWIQSKYYGNLEKNHFSADPICKLGFDPATKEHKFICTWDMFVMGHPQPPDYQRIEVLTVGDNTWRKIDEVPPYKLLNFKDPTSYLNGTIYYRNSYGTTGVQTNDKPEFIVAFDIGIEKFRSVEVPSFIRPLDTTVRPFSISEIDGRLALLTRGSGYIVKLALFDDHMKKLENTGDENWTEVTLELPFLWSDDLQLYFRSVLGTNQIILITYLRSWSYDDDSDITVMLHSFDWKKKTAFMEFEISGIPSSVPYRFPFPRITPITTFTESLLPVQKHVTT